MDESATPVAVEPEAAESARNPAQPIFTIGHSTRSLEQFIALLRAHDVTSVADVRTVPRSRHNPQFNRETLPAALSATSTPCACLTLSEVPLSDHINIRDLLLRTIIGINEEERANRQDVLISFSLVLDLHAAGASDDVADTLNYRTLTKRVIALVEGSQFYLVEKLATEIAALCLEDTRVEEVQVTVEKPGALRFARSVGVTITRTRAEMAGSRQ